MFYFDDVRVGWEYAKNGDSTLEDFYSKFPVVEFLEESLLMISN